MVVGNKPGDVSGPPQTLLNWIRENPSLYPFKGKFLNLGNHKLHYLDEGSGASPVADGGLLLLRGSKKLYCIGSK